MGPKYTRHCFKFPGVCYGRRELNYALTNAYLDKEKVESRYTRVEGRLKLVEYVS